jgi:serine/threonine-protein kinase
MLAAMLGDKRGFFAGEPVVLDPPEPDRSARAAPAPAAAQVPFLPSASFVGGPRPEPAGPAPAVTPAPASASAQFVRDGDLRAGDQVGDFVVESKIGEGGMGTVYRARHPLIGKQAAIKVIKPVFASDPVAVDRFVREARSVNEIGHRNIVDIFLFAQLPSGLPYFVMEYLDGHSLQDEMAMLGRPFTVEESRAYLAPVFSALEAAHAKGIIHRDVKPDNIFIVRGGGSEPLIKLLDFGLVKLAREVAGGSGKTSAGMPMGTPDYISPEQSVNYGVDHRTDIYSLGILLYRMLSGRLPFCAESSYDMLEQQRFAEPPPPSTFAPISTDVEDVILWALRKRAEERPQSVADLWRAFEAAAQAVPATTGGAATGGAPLGTAHTQPVEGEADDTSIDVAPRRRSWIAAAALGAAVLAIGALIFASRDDSPKPATDEPAPRAAVPATGKLRIAVQPADAAITVDGTPAAAGTDLTLAPGSYRVHARKAGYRFEEHTVVVTAGGAHSLPIVLEPEPEPAPEPAPAPLARTAVAPPVHPAATPAATPAKKPGRKSSMRDKDDTPKPHWMQP